MKKKKQTTLLSIFINFFKIGIFSFGGGLSIVSLMEKELVEKRKWISHDDFLDLIVIAESTPGPISINASTYIGYKMNKFLGALVATLALCLPSFIIIYIISLFFNSFLQNQIIANAFKGIQVCVIYLIISAGLTLYKKMEKSTFNNIMALISLIAMIIVTLFELNVSTIIFILIGAVIGLVIYLTSLCKKENKKEEVK